MPKPIDINKFDQNFIYDLELPMPKWRWVSKIIGPQGGIPGVDFDALLIESITLPNGEVLSPSPSFGGGRTTFYPDFPEVSSISVNFYETETGAANLALGNWQEAVKSREGWFGLPAKYKCRLLTNLFGYSSNRQAVMAYSGEGIWPSDGGTFDLNYTEDERLIISVTLSCDRILKGTRAG